MLGDVENGWNQMEHQQGSVGILGEGRPGMSWGQEDGERKKGKKS